MRTTMVAMLVAAGIGWAGTSSLPAAPAEGAAIGQGAASLLTPARYYRVHGRTCYTKCFRNFVIGRRVCRRYCGPF